MTHPVDELMKRMLEMGPEGFEDLAREAEAEVGAMEDLPEDVEVEYADGALGGFNFRQQAREQEVMRNLFDKLTEGIDLEMDEEE
jgi:hypothetical protein